ncbi:HD domain-containing protein [uncultured Cellulomonas sp.]|uniref:HD domain-containing protein n=1 Tax=uncultured Cellulomonas sp. TaxID=189682 RepID=UPI0026279407|nr:HD domain-containing protein [uncultured Cellulomonas sp.]
MGFAAWGAAEEVARRHVGGMEPRWSHVRTVGRRAEAACQLLALPEDVGSAAWLHDVGYGRAIMDTGFHALDGARYLRRCGTSELVVSLVAHHSGAAIEADERGLSRELSEFAAPPEDLLDVLVWADMTSGPDGELVSIDERFAEIFARYERDDAVFRAVERAMPGLRQASERASRRVALADVRRMSVL